MATSKKQIVLVLFSLAAPLAYSDLAPVTDNELADVTGQSGLTVSYSGHATLGQLKFEKLGSIQVDGITMGGAGVTASGAAAGFGTYFDDALVMVDIASDGTLDVRWEPESGSFIDWGFRADSVSLTSSTSMQTEMLSGVEAWGYLRRSYRRIEPELGSNGLSQGSNVYTAYTVEDLSADALPGTVGLKGAYVKGTESQGLQLGSATLTSEFSRWATGGAAGFDSPLSDIESGFAAMEYSYRPVAATDSPTGAETVEIQIHGFAADIGVAGMSVGQTDLGAMVLDNVQVHDTVLTFHP
ncbi:hypothetical protein LPB19_11035 [Marinobacter salinisoli]|uniref:DUF6160 domain-containing protein n=1 Tax=Marinobacter salinisoli TaxID=2769486 RepID=A0ABX7MNE2_9GAMM|nr:DUF6160 family protein [Marinobacter salinisoli]QSP93733.1 hypothetical protein LPB19_11035 [Marinobacter salinisoli]